MMKPLQKIKTFYLVVLLFIAMYSNAYGQQIRAFKYKAAIQNIDSSGVYRVKLAPELIAKSNNNLSDIRLFDNKGKNIAYVLSNKLKQDKPDSFIIFPGIDTKDQPVFSKLPPVKFFQKDTNKMTRVFIDLKESYQLNKIHLDIGWPKYYGRRILVYANDNMDNALADTILSSSGSQDISLSVKAKHLRMDIINGDDNPVTIRSIAAFQAQLYAICYLEGGHQYTLYTGDSTANVADYDLSFLNNRAYNLLPSISQFAVRNNPEFSNRLHVVPGDHSIWLWTTLIIVLVILSVLTIKMVKEVK